MGEKPFRLVRSVPIIQVLNSPDWMANGTSKSVPGIDLRPQAESER
jgi:hypothetical protein